MSIEVRNLNKRFGLSENYIKTIVKDILKILKRPSHTKLEIIFLSDTAMRPINKRFKHRDSTTDVLSFKLDGLGEVVISSDTALKNSRIFGTYFEKELVLYVIHGILHFLGYEDATAAERRRMSKKENVILELLCKKKNLSKVLTPR